MAKIKQHQQIVMSYGFMAPKLSTQIRQQGFKFNPAKIKELQDDLEHIRCLRFDYLTDQMWDKIIKKLHSHVCKHVAYANKVKIGPSKNVK